jgi:hypothetical protein
MGLGGGVLGRMGGATEAGAGTEIWAKLGTGLGAGVFLGTLGSTEVGAGNYFMGVLYPNSI